MWRKKDRHPIDGRLLGFLEARLAADEQESIGEHVRTCAACQARLDQLRVERERVAGALGTLAPGVLEQPDSQRALASLQTTSDTQQGGSMFDRIRSSRRTQRTLAGVAAAAVLVGLFALPPVRAMARDFLGLFRVERFVVVDVDPERMEQIAEALEENMFFGEQEVLEEPGEPVEVASLEEAATQAGFTPGRAEGYGEPTTIAVGTGGRMRFTPNVEALRAAFEAVDLDPALLPEGLDGQTVDITIQSAIIQTYDDGDPDEHNDFTVTQTPSPTVEMPEGVDVEALGEAMLQLIGMSPDEAARLSRSIDWTTTLVMPVPTNMATVQEVDINGTTGLLFENGDFEDVNGGGGALMWQKDGIVTVVSGGRDSTDLIDIAEALH